MWGEGQGFCESIGAVVGAGDVGAVDLFGVDEVPKVVCLAVECLAACCLGEVFHVGGGRLVVAVKLYGVVGWFAHGY